MLPPVPWKALAMIWLFWSSTNCGSIVMFPPTVVAPPPTSAVIALSRRRTRVGAVI